MNRVYHRYWLVTTLILFLCASSVVSSSAANPWYKLSGAMQPNGDIESFEISPDSQYVVFTADQESDEVFDLYSVASAGGTPIRLSSLRATAGQPEYIESYAISPDSKRVVFIGSQNEAGLLELYSVPIMGPASAVTKLNRTLPEDADLWAFSISPDSKKVVYSADQDNAKTNEIYAVPIAGPASAGIKLNDTVVNGGSLYAFVISPDSKRVIYRGDQDSVEVRELYSVPITGGVSPTKLNKTLVDNGDVEGFEIDPSSQLVVYSAYQDDSNVEELYTVPIQGPASAGKKISPSMAYGVWKFNLSADGQRVVYTAYQDSASALELYSVPVQGPGSAAVKLNKTLVADGFVFLYEISEDSTRVVYSAEQDLQGQYELYSVAIGGPASAGLKLSGQLASDGGVMRFGISPDSRHVVYTAKKQGESPTTELYSIPITGPSSAGVKLNGPLVNGGTAWYFEISPDATQVAYLADANELDQDEVFTVPITGPAASATSASGPMVDGGGAESALFSMSSQRLVYTARQESAKNVELYAIGAVAPPPPKQMIYLPMLQIAE